MMRLLGFLCLTGLLAGGLLVDGAAAPSQIPTQYEISVVPTLGGSCRINNRGDVAGSSATQTGPHAFLFRKDKLTDLGTLFGHPSYGYAINDNGVVVGFSYNVYEPDWSGTISAPRAFFYDGVLRPVPTLGGLVSVASSINNNGDIVGRSALGDGTSAITPLDFDPQHAFVYKADGALIDLGTFGGEYSVANDINNEGQVVGGAWAPGYLNFHAFLYAPDTGLQDLGTPLGTRAYATAINDRGTVVGRSWTLESPRDLVAWTWNDGMTSALPGLLGTEIWPNDINNAGLVVGQATTPTGAYDAFVSNGIVTRDLNDLIPAGSGWTLRNAWSINERGQIVAQGFGDDPNAPRCLVLTPLR